MRRSATAADWKMPRRFSRAALGAVRNHCNLVLDFVDEITRRPSLTELVSELLGPDLLVWGCSFFIKNPDSPEYVSWHQDLTYWGLDGLHEVTAWVAFSPATPDNGCMRFLPGSHRQPIVEHQDTFASENLLSRGQEVAVPVDEVRAVDVVLEPGQCSLHHGRMFHASRPNRSADRRIGLAIRYISPRMRQSSGKHTLATLVRGEDRHGHFEIAPPPRGVIDPQDAARRRRNDALLSSILYAGATERGRRQ